MAGATFTHRGSRLDRVVDVWFAELLPDRVAERAAWNLLSPDERAHARRLKREPDRLMSVRTRGLLRQVLAGYLAIAADEVSIGTGPEGKPEVVVPDGAVWPRFNVSHSGSVALIAVSECEVGVDIERVREDIEWPEVAHAFFSPAEVAAIEGVALARQRRAFFDCWVRKEAYLKGLGAGLRRATDNFQVPLGDAGGVVHDSALDGAAPLAPWHVHQLDVGRDYVAALAVKADVKVTIRHPVIS